MTLLLWARLVFLGALTALVAAYSWLTYKTRHD